MQSVSAARVSHRSSLYDAGHAGSSSRGGSETAALMDTREKIRALAAAAKVAVGLRQRGARLRLIAGYFDVLTPGHVRRLRELADGQPIMAAVLDPPDPLLPARARAELAA